MLMFNFTLLFQWKPSIRILRGYHKGTYKMWCIEFEWLKLQITLGNIMFARFSSRVCNQGVYFYNKGLITIDEDLSRDI